MKRIIALILAMLMAFALISCSKVPAEDETPDVPAEVPEAPAETPEAPAETPDEEGSTANGTPAQILLQAFKDEKAANPDITAQELADKLIANEIILFAGMALPMEPGFFSGFDVEITDFEESVMFAPMIGTIPFMGYIFELADGADVDAFVANLEENANPNWNICTSAEETVVEAVGNTVFFVMSPLSFEE